MTDTKRPPNFASDNWAPAHPDVMEAVMRANNGAVPAYGGDPYSEQAEGLIREQFGAGAQPFFVFTGTGANVLSLESCVRSYEAVICSDTAHIYTTEWGAVERNTGSRLLAIPTPDGKIDAEAVASLVPIQDGHARARPGAVSLTQATEYGTVYTPEELRAISEVAHERGLYVHMDGARLANAAASLRLSLREVSTDCGVDVLSFGGTKNGALCAEAIVFMNEHLARDFTLRRKQAMQLASKLRFMSVQFTALLSDDLWLRNARHANAMAARLGSGLAAIAGISVTQKVEANEVFVVVPRAAVRQLGEAASLQVWNEAASELRLVCSFQTTEAEVDEFVAVARNLLPA
ncbi:MAG: low specificity L-threonine aldolase [Pseudomonadota bacterium]|nr:low specificity L-threonine aldolase [Pseudomonadota bacterium]